MCKKLFTPAWLLSGAIIGAGIFALPFVFEKAGTLTGLIYLAVFGLVFVLLHLMYADVIAKTEGEHLFPGYAKIYFGNLGFWLTIISSIFGLFLTLVAYLALSASFLEIIFPNAFNGFNILIFWLLGSAAFFLEIRKMSFLELFITSGVIFISILVFAFGIPDFDKIASMPVFDFKNLFIPYGVILFSFSGRVAIPAVINYFRKTNQSVACANKSIVLGTLIPAIVYALFVFGILGLSGTVSEDAVSGLVGVVGQLVLALVAVFALVSLWDSYVIVGMDVRNSLMFDLKFPKIIAGIMVIILPILFYFYGLREFLTLAGIIGGVFIAFEGIVICLMWLKSLKTKTERVFLKKLSPVFAYVLVLVFIGGLVYELMY
ncbi:MAG: aromatic amino acid transport family protein [Candidatus Paceibacterota bacterium]